MDRAPLLRRGGVWQRNSRRSVAEAAEGQEDAEVGGGGATSDAEGRCCSALLHAPLCRAGAGATEVGLPTVK
jgi:hypothetical protein